MSQPTAPSAHSGFRLRAPVGEPQNEYDALAELFLGDEQAARLPHQLQSPAAAETVEATRPASVPAIEGLVLGHLPVMASAWVQQYARQRANECRGPVALLRLRAGEAQLDLVGVGQESSTTHRTLEAAIHDAAAHARAWIIRVSETTEPALFEQAGLGRVTMLSGADEAAVVGAYKTLKNLIRPEAEEPEVGIAFMGAGPEKAAEATAKIERAAAAFLGRPIAVTSCVAKIGGRPSAVLYRGPWAGTLDEAMIAIRTSRPRAVATRDPLVHPPTRGETKPIAPVSVAPASPVPAPMPVVSRLGSVAPGPVTASGPLASHLTGLRPIDAGCPYAPGVELALDDQGTLHLLGRCETSEMSALMTAQAWARSHGSLLRMALPALAQAQDPVLHLFTDDARRTRLLGDAPVRLHLLAKVPAGDSQVWFCTPLN